MFCSKCGNENSDGAVFCKVCGNKLDSAEQNAQINAQKEREEAVSQITSRTNNDVKKTPADIYALGIISVTAIIAILSFFCPQYSLYMGIAGAVINLGLAILDTGAEKEKIGNKAFWATLILQPLYFYIRSSRLKKGWHLLIASIIVFCMQVAVPFLVSNKSNELSAYLSAMENIFAMENSIIGKHASITGDNYTDDLTVYNMLKNEIIPESRKLVDASEKIRIEKKELRDIHELFIDGWNAQLNSFIVTGSAIETNDSLKVAEANDLLAKVKKLFRDYQDALTAYARKNGASLASPQTQNLNQNLNGRHQLSSNPQTDSSTKNTQTSQNMLPNSSLNKIDFNEEYSLIGSETDFSGLNPKFTHAEVPDPTEYSCNGTITVNVGDDSVLNVRYLHGSVYQVVGQLQNGQTYPVSDWAWGDASDTRWYYIEDLKNQVSGWVNGDFCTTYLTYNKNASNNGKETQTNGATQAKENTPTNNANPLMAVNITGDNVNVRNAPNAKGKVLFQVGKEDFLVVNKNPVKYNAPRK